ncbi:hypothetical protein [Fimbriiglobus ruber]|uniref:hypothetical protein n=1 Tax=Fimbriiglobus ruber TaxID=1908690 RepID=UPI000B4A72E0|nr:hypothetical protein [Fimbriiglobus ruber]
MSVGAGPTALEVDAWGLRRGRDLVAASDRVRVAGADAFAAADYFTAAFDPDPRPTASCADPRRHQFLTRLLDTPEYHALHATTRLDDTAAAIAAAHFAEQFAQLRKEEETERDPRAPADRPGGAGGRLDREMATLRAVRRAVTAADKEVAELHDTAAALGLGPGSEGRHDPRAVAAAFQRSAATPPCGGSATWPAGSGGSPSRSSGRRPSTGWTTWSGSRRAGRRPTPARRTGPAGRPRARTRRPPPDRRETSPVSRCDSFAGNGCVSSRGSAAPCFGTVTTSFLCGCDSRPS